MKNITILLSILIFTFFKSYSDNIDCEGQSNTVYFPGNGSIIFDNLWVEEDFPKNQITVSAWVRWNDFSNAGQWANILTYTNSSGGSGDTNGSFWLQHNQNNDRYEFALRNSSGSRVHVFGPTDDGYRPEVGVWHHVVGVYNGSNITIYVNGLQGDTRNITGEINWNINNELNIGRWANSQNNYRFFNGYLIHLSIINKSLTEEEVLDLYFSTESFLDNSDDLIGYWRLDDIFYNENDTYIVPDKSSFNIIGKLTGEAQPDCVELPYYITNPMPIELLSFTSKIKENSIELEWVTVSEINNDYFILEKSEDLKNWTIVSYIQGAGNSNTILTYSFEDFNPIQGISYYRLTQHDFDGQFEVFNPISTYWNPNGNYKIVIYDFIGVLLKEEYTSSINNYIIPKFGKPIIVLFYNENGEIIRTIKSN